MNIYISWKNETKKIMLPVNPSAISIESAQNNTSLYIHNKGEVNLKGKRGLYTITIESFFPSKKYNFYKGKFHDPYTYYVWNLKLLYDSNRTIHLVITDTNINMFCTIENFKYGENDGTGDVSYSITLKEYREVKSTKAKKRLNTKENKSVYKWRKGDTWPKVCKKILGSSKNWKKVRSKNLKVIKQAKKKNPKKKESTALIGYKVVVKMG